MLKISHFYYVKAEIGSVCSSVEIMLLRDYIFQNFLAALNT